MGIYSIINILYVYKYKYRGISNIRRPNCVPYIYSGVSISETTAGDENQHQQPLGMTHTELYFLSLGLYCNKTFKFPWPALIQKIFKETNVISLLLSEKIKCIYLYLYFTLHTLMESRILPSFHINFPITIIAMASAYAIEYRHFYLCLSNTTIPDGNVEVDNLLTNY